MWNNPRRYYLTEVLGLRLDQSAAVHAESNHPAKIFIFSKTEPSHGAKQLIDKMLSAIGITGYQFHTGRPIPADARLITFGEAPEESKADLYLPAWEEFFAPYDPTAIQELKKDTWEKLKKFKAQGN